MTALPLALSLSSTFTKIGAVAAFAALLGIAVLSLLVFSQARELKRLREWAGRAPGARRGPRATRQQRRRFACTAGASRRTGCADPSPRRSRRQCRSRQRVSSARPYPQLLQPASRRTQAERRRHPHRLRPVCLCRRRCARARRSAGARPRLPADSTHSRRAAVCDAYAAGSRAAGPERSTGASGRARSCGAAARPAFRTYRRLARLGSRRSTEPLCRRHPAAPRCRRSTASRSGNGGRHRGSSPPGAEPAGDANAGDIATRGGLARPAGGEAPTRPCPHRCCPTHGSASTDPG